MGGRQQGLKTVMKWFTLTKEIALQICKSNPNVVVCAECGKGILIGETVISERQTGRHTLYFHRVCYAIRKKRLATQAEVI